MFLPSYADFTGLSGEPFRVVTTTGPTVEVVLIEAAALGPPAPAGSAGSSACPQPFSLVFRGPGDSPLPQGTYRFEHGGLGAFDLFIVPIGPDRVGLRYEAIFN